MTSYRKDALLAALRAGARPTYLHFLDYRATPGEGPTKACLSQWWKAPFEVDGLIFPTSEHFMMHAKARLFGDEEIAGRILRSAHPYDAKILGRRVHSFDESAWNAAREEIVLRGCLEKFKQNAAERAFLLGTGDAVLVEATAEDPVWGSGVWETSERASQPELWPGLNLLGFLLMDARRELGRGKG